MLEDSPLGGDAPRSNIPGPKQIRFELTEPNRKDIEKAKAHFELVKSKQKLHAEFYPAYGKEVVRKWIKRTFAYARVLD